MRRCIILCGCALFTLLSSFTTLSQERRESVNPPIYIAFLWHMHQPVYWPYETVGQTDQNGRYSYSVTDIHNQRTGPYTSWPKDAVQKGIIAGLSHFGAQVSFSGSLIENLNNLETTGNGNFQNWKSSWNSIKTQTTVLGNPRLDMVGFGYHHPLMGLIEYDDIRKQIQSHKQMMSSQFSGIYSKGMFPPENAFSPRMIPALADEGMQWVMVDNIHFDRTCQGYPFSTAGNMYEPNKADVRNANPNDWVQLNGLWAPTQNSARWGRQPHYVEYVDPSTGVPRKIIAVPTDRYLGNEDGRGGFGALNYEYVMSQLESYNTDPQHPILIVLHHDGDNYGGGSESYYNSNFQNFVNWLQANPARFVCSTVQDYLQMFPPDSTNPIHIEDGSWSGADNGDPEFKKWNGDPAGNYSPDRNSWGIITAAKNIVSTANQINPNSPNTQNAWKFFLNGEASDYWYWDGSQNGIWDSHPARASNLAIPYAQSVISSGTDLTPPTIYVPQREPYNPGATEWGINQPNDFTVWTYVFDISGLASVKLKFRLDADGQNSNANNHNETYAGGSDVSPWNELVMTGTTIASQTNPQPLYKAKEYSAQITGLTDKLADYYVEAVDSNGNVARSPIQHVWVGSNSTGGGTTGVLWSPTAPTKNDTITVTVNGVTQGAKLHWGVNNTGNSWSTPNSVYWPSGTTLFNGTGPAVQTQFSGPDSGKLTIKIGPFNNPVQRIDKVAFVIHYNDNSWNNNNGQDFHITISGNPPPQQGYVMDGAVDASSAIAASNGGLSLYLGWNGVQLYTATQSAQSQNGDMFIIVADSQRSTRNAMWAKSGSVAGWNAFIGNESTNNWNGWFNSSGSQTTGSGVNSAAGALEGALNVESYFGYVPPVVYIAVGKYQTQDGGALTAQVPQGNGNVNIETAEFFAYPLDSVISAPSTPGLIAPPDNGSHQPLSVTLQWSPASSATSYGVQLSTDSTFTGGFVFNLASVADTFTTVTGLAQLTPYYWRVNAGNIGGISNWSEPWAFTTELRVPSQVDLVSPVNASSTGPDSVLLLWRKAGIAVSHYLLLMATDSLFSSQQADSSLTDTTKAVTSLIPHQTYWWKVSARNASGWGVFSTARKFTALPNFVTLPLSFIPGWNMISNPVNVANDSLLSLFPGSSLPYAFSFDPVSGYVQSPLLNNGAGYWTKFATSGNAFIGGMEIIHDTIAVSAGWNMIGSISSVVPDSNTFTLPSGLRDSPFYEYTSGYTTVNALQPGKAYWVKMNANGLLILSSETRDPSGTTTLGHSHDK